MQKMITSPVNCKSTFGINDSDYNGIELEKPMLCPSCNAYVSGTITNKCLHPRLNNIQYGTVCYSCPHCRAHYIATYKIDFENKSGALCSLAPSATYRYENPILSQVSPRFVLYYNQSLRAESAGDIELSAVGYRQALECLVKDYAITELNADRSTVVKQPLFDAIKAYLKESELIAAADVVRILGNDYAHYDRRYPQHDFEILKTYMDIFIKMVEVRLLIAHPPVSQ